MSLRLIDPCHPFPPCPPCPPWFAESQDPLPPHWEAADHSFVTCGVNDLRAAGFTDEANVLHARFGFLRTELVQKLYNDGEKTAASLAKHVRHVAQYPTTKAALDALLL